MDRIYLTKLGSCIGKSIDNLGIGILQVIRIESQIPHNTLEKLYIGLHTMRLLNLNSFSRMRSFNFFKWKKKVLELRYFLMWSQDLFY